MDENNGMSVKEFIQGEHLKRGDIVLCRGKKGMLSRMIRWGTKSYFSHAALVFAVPHPDEGFDKAFVIESVGDGIDLTDLEHYLQTDDYDIAVRRLEQPWFKDKSPELPKMIRGHMLDFIKANYDLRMILRLGFSLAVNILLRRKHAPFEELLQELLERDTILPSAFICSGFVQHGYYKTVNKLVERGKLPASALEDVTFHPTLAGGSTTPRRLATSPKEIACSEKLVWKYLSYRENGETRLYPISSRTELESFYGPL
ncbi:MAG: hypothetical protein OEZ16_05675 [Chromatiales bacterium]|nr:hypothetical protein [Chromatiales bacterium]